MIDPTRIINGAADKAREAAKKLQIALATPKSGTEEKKKPDVGK